MNVDNSLKSPSTLSICTGVRGLERGIERVIGPVRSIAYVEIEAFIISNLLAGMEAGILAPAPIWANLKTFPWHFFRGKVDLLMGGYPCQPFSNAGKGLAAADPSHLWPYIESGIRTIRPVCCFFENVAAHLNKGYREVKRSLEEMGYVVKEGIYAAEEVGAPHLRERLFILAILDDAGCPTWWENHPRRLGRIENNLFGQRQESADRFECAGEELEHASSIDGRLYEGFGRSGEAEIESERTGQKLADADSDGPGANAGSIGETSGQNEGEIQWEKRNGLFGQRGRGDFGNGSSEMADALSEGLEGQRARRIGPGPELSLSSAGNSDRWPARPGEPQQAWECPRLISRAAESSLGISVNGYSFREDLLRALGNSVVEQQAEYAFRDLIGKHLKSLS